MTARITVDNQLIEKAMQLSGSKTREEAAEKALHLLIQVVKREAVQKLIKRDKTGILSTISLKDLQSALLNASIFFPEKKEIGSEKEFLVALSAQLYDKAIFSAGQAAAFVGISKSDFIRKMGNYQVSVFGETAEDIQAL